MRLATFDETAILHKCGLVGAHERERCEVNRQENDRQTEFQLQSLQQLEHRGLPIDVQRAEAFVADEDARPRGEHRQEVDEMALAARELAARETIIQILLGVANGGTRVGHHLKPGCFESSAHFAASLLS